MKVSLYKAKKCATFEIVSFLWVIVFFYLLFQHNSQLSIAWINCAVHLRLYYLTILKLPNMLTLSLHFINWTCATNSYKVSTDRSIMIEERIKCLHFLWGSLTNYKELEKVENCKVFWNDSMLLLFDKFLGGGPKSALVFPWLLKIKAEQKK